MSVRHSLLGLLAQQPRYGYELRAAFTALAGGRENWEVTPAQIYTTINRMLDSGLICIIETTPELPNAKQVYSITTSGQEELIRWFQADVYNEPQQDVFYLKLMLSRNLDFVDTPRLIQIQRNSLYQKLHSITGQRQKLNAKTELAQILLMDKAVMHLEADLRWLDMVEARLEEVIQQPSPELDLRPRGRPQKQTLIRTQIKEKK